MKEIGLEPQFYYPDGDNKGFQKRVPWTDDECILIALDNSRNLCGLDKTQVERLIKERMPKPKLKPGEKNDLPPVKSINGISVILLGGALGKGYMKDWSEEHINEWKEYEKTLRK